jgi:iron-sulfur cluster repair protein YtfE (RIC family)
MNAVDLLKADHDRVETLFEKFKKNENGNNTALFKQIRNELETHTHIEEAIFYPAALKRGKKDLKKIVREGLEEHAQVKRLLAELSKMTSRNKQFNPKLTVVVENVEHHIEEEEDEMFPLYEDQFSERQLETLGAEMETEKLRFQKKHRIKPLREEKGAVAKLVDRTKEMVSEIFTGTLDGSSPKNGRARAAGGKKQSTAKSRHKSTEKERAARAR